MKSKMKEIVGQGLAPAAKKLLSLLLSLVMLLSIIVGVDVYAYVLPDLVEAVYTEAFTYYLWDDGSVSFRTNPYCTEKKMEIPSSFQGHTIDFIFGDDSFNGDNKYVETVVLPNTLKELGGYSFCSFTRLKEVNIPSKCTRIGYSAFQNCDSLESFVLDKNIEKIDLLAFYDCDNLKSITILNKDCVIGDNDNQYNDLTINDTTTIVGYSGSTAEAYAKRYNRKFVALDSECSHSWDDGKVTKKATCTANGVKTYTCSKCKTTNTETIKATGHKAVADKAVAATCITAGKTEGSHCSVCNTVITAQKTVAATGHSYDTGKITQAATVATNGIKTYTCTACGETKTEIIPATGLKAPAANYTVNSDRTFTISWAKITGADKYEIYSYNASTGKYKYVKTTTALSHKTGAAAFGTTYKYKIRAVNSENNVKSGYCTVSAVNNQYLPAPAVKYAVNSDCTLTLSWAKATGADKYEIYSYNASTGKYKYVKTTTELSYKTGRASYGVTYKYKIRAVNSANNIKSGYCTVNAVNNKKLTTPSASLKVNTNGSFTISWSKITGATKYEVYIFDSNIGDYRLSRTTTGTSITTGTAAKGVTYYYKVRAVTSKNSSATSNFSAVVKGTR